MNLECTKWLKLVSGTGFFCCSGRTTESQMDVKTGAPGKRCSVAMRDREGGWGSPTSPASSAVGSFGAVLAMWKQCRCLKWSKHCYRQAPGAFTRCHGNLSRSGPHIPAIKIHLLCCWAPPAGCSAGELQTEKIRANSCCLLLRAWAFETPKELPGARVWPAYV